MYNNFIIDYSAFDAVRAGFDRIIFIIKEENYNDFKETIGKRLEGKIDKCKEYIQEKADVISFRVNGRLNDCVIDMWSTQKDGTLVPDTVLRGKDGVKFGSLNFAQQIKSKIELQMLFLRHFGISLPLWVDEATVFDSSNKPSFDNQTIFLYASDSPFLTIKNE